MRWYEEAFLGLDLGGGFPKSQSGKAMPVQRTGIENLAAAFAHPPGLLATLNSLGFGTSNE
eukprot:364481-Chlamydomonas_euryale.AAC.19